MTQNKLVPGERVGHAGERSTREESSAVTLVTTQCCGFCFWFSFRMLAHFSKLDIARFVIPSCARRKSLYMLNAVSDTV
jgi:hypothetical protein